MFFLLHILMYDRIIHVCIICYFIENFELVDYKAPHWEDGWYINSCSPIEPIIWAHGILIKVVANIIPSANTQRIQSGQP